MRIDDDMLVRLGISRFGVDEDGEREASGSEPMLLSELVLLIARLSY